jgi:hypothetical protein
MAEVGEAMSPQGFLDVEKLAGPKADLIRGIVKHCWELSLRYLHVFPIVGIEAVRKFLVMEREKPPMGQPVRQRPAQIRAATVSRPVSEMGRLLHTAIDNYVME